MQTTSSRSAAAIKAAETRRINKAEQRAIYRRENYLIYNAEEWQDSYPANSNTIEEVLDRCAEMVTDLEYSLPAVAVWLDGELVGAAKRGGHGEAVLTVYHGPYAGWRKVVPN
jgi:hypothetical protein